MRGSEDFADYRPRASGDPVPQDKDWMPAFAGMTTESVAA